MTYSIFFGDTLSDQICFGVQRLADAGAEPMCPEKCKPPKNMYLTCYYYSVNETTNKEMNIYPAMLILQERMKNASPDI